MSSAYKVYLSLKELEASHGDIREPCYLEIQKTVSYVHCFLRQVKGHAFLIRQDFKDKFKNHVPNFHIWTCPCIYSVV